MTDSTGLGFTEAEGCDADGEVDAGSSALGASLELSSGAGTRSIHCSDNASGRLSPTRYFTAGLAAFFGVGVRASSFAGSFCGSSGAFGVGGSVRSSGERKGGRSAKRLRRGAGSGFVVSAGSGLGSGWSSTVGSESSGVVPMRDARLRAGVAEVAALGSADAGSCAAGSTDTKPRALNRSSEAAGTGAGVGTSGSAGSSSTASSTPRRASRESALCDSSEILILILYLVDRLFARPTASITKPAAKLASARAMAADTRSDAAASSAFAAAASACAACVRACCWAASTASGLLSTIHAPSWVFHASSPATSASPGTPSPSGTFTSSNASALAPATAEARIGSPPGTSAGWETGLTTSADASTPGPGALA